MKTYALLLSASLLAAMCSGQITTPPLSGDQRTEWFRDAKFGMFIHWGPYAIVGRHEWARHRFQIPQAEYDHFARSFNPVNYDAEEWANLAWKAGARYMVITSKHHDGFSIYRSKVSDYDMEITPYSGDPLQMLAAACRRKGMRLGFYHSIMDWRHPDYRPRRAWEAEDPKAGGNLDRYIDFMKVQLRELLTGFGEVAVIWFDGEWEHTTAEMRSDEVYDFIRSIQPNTLINDRLYKREPGNRADFGTPEQFVPATGVLGPDGKPVLWESCVTINNDSWGYNKYETEFKTTRDLVRMLVEVVSKGGNLLLNVGPTPDGRIQPEFVTRLNAIGEWMDRNGESIYGTTASPFRRLPFFGRATTKKNAVYLHVFSWPKDGRLRIPALRNLVNSAVLLARPDEKLAVAREGGEMVITLPGGAPDETASVVKLILDGAPDAAEWTIRPDEKGTVHLPAESCEIETSFGQRAKKENFLGHVFVTNWSRAADKPTWAFQLPRPGRYRVHVSYGSGRGGVGTEYTVAAGAAKVTAKVQQSGGDWVFKSFDIGVIDLPAGDLTLQVSAAIKGGTAAMNLESVTLTPAGGR